MVQGCHTDYAAVYPMLRDQGASLLNLAFLKLNHAPQFAIVFFQDHLGGSRMLGGGIERAGFLAVWVRAR